MWFTGILRFACFAFSVEILKRNEYRKSFFITFLITFDLTIGMKWLIMSSVGNYKLLALKDL
jgi:hypothetical protein